MESTLEGLSGKTICPLSVFRHSLVEFAAAVVISKKKRAYFAPRGYGGTPAQVEQKMIWLFKTNHPELLACLKRLIVKGDSECLYWTGPSIKIRRHGKYDTYLGRDYVMKLPPQLDFDDCNIFLSDEPEGGKPEVDNRQLHNPEDGETVVEGQKLEVGQPDVNNNIPEGKEEHNCMVVSPVTKETPQRTEDPDIVMKGVDETGGQSGDQEEEVEGTRKKDKKGKGKADKKGKGKAHKSHRWPSVHCVTRSQLSGSSKSIKASAAVVEGSTSAPKHSAKRALLDDSKDRKENGKRRKQK